MDKKREDDKIFDTNVKCVRDFSVWSKLLSLGYQIVDVNKDKSFICPYHDEKCTFKSVLYFRRDEGFDEDLESIYKELEEDKRG